MSNKNRRANRKTREQIDRECQRGRSDEEKETKQNELQKGNILPASKQGEIMNWNNLTERRKTVLRGFVSVLSLICYDDDDDDDGGGGDDDDEDDDDDDDDDNDG